MAPGMSKTRSPVAFVCFVLFADSRETQHAVNSGSIHSTCLIVTWQQSNQDTQIVIYVLAFFGHFPAKLGPETRSSGSSSEARFLARKVSGPEALLRNIGCPSVRSHCQSLFRVSCPWPVPRETRSQWGQKEGVTWGALLAVHTLAADLNVGTIWHQ